MVKWLKVYAILQVHLKLTEDLVVMVWWPTVTCVVVWWPVLVQTWCETGCTSKYTGWCNRVFDLPALNHSIFPFANPTFIDDNAVNLGCLTNTSLTAHWCEWTWRNNCTLSTSTRWCNECNYCPLMAAFTKHYMEMIPSIRLIHACSSHWWMNGLHYCWAVNLICSLFFTKEYWVI